MEPIKDIKNFVENIIIKGMLTTVLSEKARECDLCLTRKFFLNKTAQYISLD